MIDDHSELNGNRSRPGTGSFSRESQTSVRSALSLTMERFGEKVTVPLLQAVNGYDSTTKANSTEVGSILLTKVKKSPSADGPTEIRVARSFAQDGLAQWGNKSGDKSFPLFSTLDFTMSKSDDQ